MEPAALFPELLGDRVDEGGGVVVEGGLDLGDALRRRAARPSPGARAAASGGTIPSSAQAAVAASSTSSQARSLPSSDQILAMAGRE